MIFLIFTKIHYEFKKKNNTIDLACVRALKHIFGNKTFARCGK